MKIIDINQWDRKEHFEFFMQMDIPQYVMTFEIDVTPLVLFVKRQQSSFYLSMMHTVMKTVNQMEHFRYRMVEKEVVLYDQVDPSFTDVLNDQGLFKYVTTPYHYDLTTFIQTAQSASKAQTTFIDLKQEQRRDVVYVTTFPWSSFLAGTHPMNIDKYDAIPRIAWGRFERKDGHDMMPLTLMVHHAFIDGYHLGLYLEKLKENIQKYLEM